MYGLDIQRISLGAQIDQSREDDELRSIIMRPIAHERRDVSGLRNVLMFNQVPATDVPNAQVVDDLKLVFEAGTLCRIDRIVAITAQSDNAPGVLSGDPATQRHSPTSGDFPNSSVGTHRCDLEPCR